MWPGDLDLQHINLENMIGIIIYIYIDRDSKFHSRFLKFQWNLKISLLNQSVINRQTNGQNAQIHNCIWYPFEITESEGKLTNLLALKSWTTVHSLPFKNNKLFYSFKIQTKTGTNVNLHLLSNCEKTIASFWVFWKSGVYS